MSLAWHTAAFQRIDKLPKLESILSRANRGRQTPTEQKTMLSMLSDQLGVPLKRVRLIRKDAA